MRPGGQLELVRERAPLVHNITNYVTVNDCANALLACGASPIMADEPEEAAEIASICSALCINIGTLNERTIKAMHIAALRMAELSRPIVLDPVGVGASELRTRTALELIERARPTVIRGNMTEIRTLAEGTSGSRGVDALPSDASDEETLSAHVELCRALARRTGAVVSASGEIDVIATADRVALVRNGDALMSSITGAGCMLACLTAAFAAASPDDPFTAAASAAVMHGLCGEIARARMTGADGTGAFRSYLIDALSSLRPEELDRGARCEVRA